MRENYVQGNPYLLFAVSNISRPNRGIRNHAMHQFPVEYLSFLRRLLSSNDMGGENLSRVEQIETFLLSIVLTLCLRESKKYQLCEH